MAIKQGTQNVPIDTLRVNAFSGGMNTSGSARDIADNECVLIENFEFDDLDNLVTRNGITTAPIGLASTRASSMFSFNTEAGFIGILTSGSVGALFSSDILGNSSSIGGLLTLPVNNRWYWKSLNNVAIGVNSDPVGTNPVRVVGPGPGTATAHGTGAPRGKYIEEWNSRLFIVHQSNPNRVQCCDLGNPDLWNTGGLVTPNHGIVFDVAAGDGDIITALYATKERLFIFKRKKIYVLRATADPNTDPSNWEVVEYATEIGCVNQATIREVFDDVVFLSEGGLASLAAAEITGDFSSAIISHKISEIQRIRKDAPEWAIFGFTLADRSQYWLCVDGSVSPNGKNTVWVMDYKRIQQGVIRWVTFTGAMFPSAMDLYGVSQEQNTYVLGVADTAPGQFRLAQYKPNTPESQRVYTDILTNKSYPIIQRLDTKAYDFGADDIRKKYQYWYWRFGVLSNRADFKVTYEMDEPYEPYVLYEFSASKIFNREKTVRQAFKHDSQRKSVHVKFGLTMSAGLNQGISVKNFGIQYGILNERRSESMNVSALFKNVSYVIERNRTVLGNVGAGNDLIFNYPLPFDSLKSDGDFIDILSGGGIALNNNDKLIALQIEGDPVTGAAGDFVTGMALVDDLDGASGRHDSWTMFARIMRLSATSVLITGTSMFGRFFADGVGALLDTNGLMRGDNRVITVADLNINDLYIQVIGQGVANNDVVHRGTVIQLNQQ